MSSPGPDVIKTVTHEDVTKETPGGSIDSQLGERRGPLNRQDDAECCRMIRELLTYLPQNNRESPPRRACTDPIDRMDSALDTAVRTNRNVPYDIKDVIHRVAMRASSSRCTSIGRRIWWLVPRAWT